MKEGTSHIFLKFNQPFADSEQKAEFVIRPGF